MFSDNHGSRYLLERRNRHIRERFVAFYGKMPTMLLYAHLAQEFRLSEETVRKIVRQKD